MPAQVAQARFHVGALLAGGLWAAAHGLTRWAVYDFALLLVLLLPVEILLINPGLSFDFDNALVTGVLATAWLVLFFPALVAWGVLRVILARHGYQWAWQHGAFRSFREFRRAQALWTVGAFVIVVVAAFVVLGLASFTGGTSDAFCST